MNDTRYTKVLAELRHLPRRGMAIQATVAFLGLWGFHARTIGEITGLSTSAVYTRLHKWEISLRDYRNGKTDVAQRLIGKSPIARYRIGRR